MREVTGIAPSSWSIKCPSPFQSLELFNIPDSHPPFNLICISGSSKNIFNTELVISQSYSLPSIAASNTMWRWIEISELVHTFTLVHTIIKNEDEAIQAYKEDPFENDKLMEWLFMNSGIQGGEIWRLKEISLRMKKDVWQGRRFLASRNKRKRGREKRPESPVHLNNVHYHHHHHHHPSRRRFTTKSSFQNLTLNILLRDPEKDIKLKYVV